MSGVGVVGCGERASKIKGAQRRTEREGSRVRFSAQETMLGWGMKSVELHRVSVCAVKLCPDGCLEPNYSMGKVSVEAE